MLISKIYSLLKGIFMYVIVRDVDGVNRIYVLDILCFWLVFWVEWDVWKNLKMYISIVVFVVFLLDFYVLCILV